MSVQEYKQRLHEVIDAASDEAALRELLDTANRMLTGRDILDDLSEEQLARIDSSMEQIKRGSVVPSSRVKEEAMQWLKKR